MPEGARAAESPPSARMAPRAAPTRPPPAPPTLQDDDAVPAAPGEGGRGRREAAGGETDARRPPSFAPSAGAWGAPAPTTASAWDAPAPAAAAPPVIGVSDDVSQEGEGGGRKRARASAAAHRFPPPQRNLASVRAALDARERSLAAREAALARAEADVRRSGGGANLGPDKNWPRGCPVVHHDIQGEVPAGAQGCVRAAYGAYLGLCLCLLFNAVAVLVRLGAAKMDPTKLPSFLMAMIYLCAGVPGAWVLW